MKIEYTSKPDRLGGETTVAFITKEQRDHLPIPVNPREFSGALGAVLLIHSENLLCVGLGQDAKVDATAIRRAAGVAGMQLKRTGRTAAALELSHWPQYIGAALEGILLADYRFEQFKKDKTPAIERLRIKALDVTDAKKQGKRAETLAHSVNFARQINNLPGNLLFPAALADTARKLATAKKLKATILDLRQLRAKKFGGILAVGSGSEREPRLIVLEHQGAPASEKPIALIGKAITFDTGGISIKPAQNMENMIFDKSGGITVLGAMSAIAALGIKKNVVGIIPSAENMPSGNAYRPGDIVAMYDGKPVEIVNTDAEGRMVLADAIAFARKDKKAAAIVDLATLTGACGIALGDAAAGLWSTDDKLRDALLAASSATGERLWPMPLFPEYEDQIKSDVALIKNSGGRLAGASTGAAFLKTFADAVPWAHLDIAYTAAHEKDKPYIARGATGFGIRTLVDFVERF